MYVSLEVNSHSIELTNEGKGSGKSAIIHRVAEVLGYHTTHVEVVQLYKDMTSRDLLQRSK